MGSPLQAIMALLQGQPKSPVRTTPDGSLDIRSILAGSQILPEKKSPYERTMRPGETRSAGDVQDMLAEVILAAGSGALPGAGPRGQARISASRPNYAKMSGLKGADGSEVVKYEWRYKVGEGRTGAPKRVSDWDNSDTSTGTGREIVHVFHVKRPDGSITPEGINSAANLLGLSASTLRTRGKGAMEWAAKQAKYAESDARAFSFPSKEAALSDPAPGVILVRDGKYVKVPADEVTAGRGARLIEHGWGRIDE